MCLLKKVTNICMLFQQAIYICQYQKRACLQALNCVCLLFQQALYTCLLILTYISCLLKDRLGRHLNNNGSRGAQSVSMWAYLPGHKGRVSTFLMKIHIFLTFLANIHIFVTFLKSTFKTEYFVQFKLYPRIHQTDLFWISS